MDFENLKILPPFEEIGDKWPSHLLIANALSKRESNERFQYQSESYDSCKIPEIS